MSPGREPHSPNHLLAAVPGPVYRKILRRLVPVELTYGQVLYEPQGTIDWVYFPIDSLVSLLTAVDAQRSLEVGMVGNEGMVGVPMASGIGISTVRALVQGSGTAMALSAAGFRTEFRKHVSLQHAVFRYNHLLMAQISQTAACNRFHEVGPRLARWLLMTADRVHSNEFHLTHEFLAHMLGIRRVGVTEAAVLLENKGDITYSRGAIKILRRKGLEASACSCYMIVRRMQAIAQPVPRH